MKVSSSLLNYVKYITWTMSCVMKIQNLTNACCEWPPDCSDPYVHSVQIWWCPLFFLALEEDGTSPHTLQVAPNLAENVFERSSGCCYLSHSHCSQWSADKLRTLQDLFFILFNCFWIKLILVLRKKEMFIYTGNIQEDNFTNKLFWMALWHYCIILQGFT